MLRRADAGGERAGPAQRAIEEGQDLAAQAGAGPGGFGRRVPGAVGGGGIGWGGAVCGYGCTQGAGDAFHRRGQVFHRMADRVHGIVGPAASDLHRDGHAGIIFGHRAVFPGGAALLQGGPARGAPGVRGEPRQPHLPPVGAQGRIGRARGRGELHRPQPKLSPKRQRPLKWMSSAKRSVVAPTAITAFSAGGCRKAVCRALKPPQLLPTIPIQPLHPGWRASQALTSQASDSFCGVYSLAIRPSLSPLSRISTRAQG